MDTLHSHLENTRNPEEKTPVNSVKKNKRTISEIHDILTNRGVKLFVVLGSFFIANAIIAEFMGVKIFSFEQTAGIKPVHWRIFGGDFNLDLSAGVLLWPVVFIMTDIINEYFGPRGVRFLSYLGAVLIAYAYFMYYGSIQLVPAGWWPGSQATKGTADMNSAYNAIFGQGMSIIIGSLAAFVLGQVIDVAIFHRIKKITGEKYLWLRSTGSTLFSQLVDTYVVTSLAFYFIPIMFPSTGQTPWTVQQLLTVSTGGYIYKFIVAIAMTPIIYLVHGIIESYLGKDLAKRMRNLAAGDS